MKLHRHLSIALVGALSLSSLCATGWSAAAATVEFPVGTFIFTAPSDPPTEPSGYTPPNPITPMVYLFGTYQDNSTNFSQPITVDLTMDQTGKVASMISVDGFADKKGNSQLTESFNVKTVNGVPVATASTSTTGTFDDGTAHSASGNGAATISLGSAPTPQNNVEEVTVSSSFSGKEDTGSAKRKTNSSNLFLDYSQLDGSSGGVVSKSWNMTLALTQQLDAKNKPFVSASLDVFKSDGTETFFAARLVKYTVAGGYSFSFKGGTAYNSGSPVLDSKGKPVIDKYTSISFAKMFLKESFDNIGDPSWTPAAGGVFFKFLGQSGFGHVFNFDIQ